MPIISLKNSSNVSEAFETLWKEVFRDGTRNGDIHILSACEIDAICAAKILEKLCSRSNLACNVFPAVDWFQVQEQITKHGDDYAAPGVIVLLNCGATQNLSVLLDELPSTIIVCLDTHRPYCWENISKDGCLDEVKNRVWIIDDDPFIPETIFSDDNDPFAAGPDSLNDPLKRRKIDGKERLLPRLGEEKEPLRANGNNMNAMNPQFGGSSSSSSGVPDSYGLGGSYGVVGPPSNYYSTTWYATPASLTILKLAEHLDAIDKSHLWHAMVAISQYEEYCLTPSGAMDLYTSYVAESLQGRTGPKILDHLIARGIAPRQEDAKDGDLQIDSKNITYQDDIRAFMYRHWALNSSFQHTSLVYGRMRLNKESGHSHLAQFFAESAVTVEESRKVFRTIPGHISNTLRAKFKEKERRHNIEGIVSKTFVRFFARFVGTLKETEFSAGDIVHITGALLETNVSDGIREILESEYLSATTADTTADAGGGGGAAAGVGGGGAATGGFGDLEEPGGGEAPISFEDKVQLSYKTECANIRRNFWRVYDCLAYRDASLLKEGLDAALGIQQMIVHQAKIFIDEKSILCHKKLFYWVRFNIGSQDIFRRPQVLKRLALWLIDVRYKYALRKSHQMLPQIVVAGDTLRHTVLVVGQLPFKKHTGSFQNEKSNFQLQFKTAARAANVTFKCDYSDPDVIEVGEKGFKKFWRELMR